MSNKIVKAIYGSPDCPLRLGNVEIPCYVLEDGKRVIVRNGMYIALNMSSGGSGERTRTGADRLHKFLNTKAIKPFASNELQDRTNNPLKFTTTGGGNAYGYEATILADICEAVLEARKEGSLNRQQEHIAEQCEILVRAFAKVGIIALVDEATGYQYVRARKELNEFLDKFIADELLKWTKTFPDEFYQQLFRLRGWRYSPLSVKRPTLIGKLTNDIVYTRLGPNVLDELKKRNPKNSRGKRRHKYFQWLTEDVGHPKLREHLAQVIVLMRATTRWDDFKRLLNRALPKWESMPLFDQIRQTQEKQKEN